ncbi:PKD domain-containing protein [Christiangramia crocea]|uniref:PKD domain-containing protein n=1 Tax=Christiangramia crocea TaxID=2904124 RepID=A0A9X1UYQ4_9FLAO|nr:PKD domain-containing protein [Gramella crocea]MCG9972862.1 PKD domain-containing protein [Gramella crocea]
MKNFKFKRMCLWTLTIFIGLVTSCSDDDVDYPPFSPTLSISSEVDANEPLTVHFTSKTTNAESYMWDFGDGNTSTEANPSHTYADYGEYEVSVVVNGVEGSVPAEQNKTVVLEEAYDSGLIDMEGWIVQEATPGVTVTVDANSINFQGPGGWTGSHIFQEITVEPGTYKFRGNLTVNSVVDETWAELIFSDIEPQEGEDYVPSVDYQVIYSTWNGSPTSTGTYSFSEYNSGGVYPDDGLYTFDTAQSFYIVIKSGSNQPYDLTFTDLSFIKVE